MCKAELFVHYVYQVVFWIAMDIVIIQHQMFQLVAKHILLFHYIYILVYDVMQILLLSYKQ